MTVPSRPRTAALRLAVFAITLSALSGAVCAGRALQALVRGPGYSDVGVPLYHDEGPAALLAMGVSISLGIAALWLLYRFLPAGRGLVAWFGIPWLIVCNGLLLFAIWLGL